MDRIDVVVADGDATVALRRDAVIATLSCGVRVGWDIKMPVMERINGVRGEH